MGGLGVHSFAALRWSPTTLASWTTGALLMSHYSAIRTQMVSTDALVAALGELGFAEVEVHDEPQALIGYLGDQRRQRAQVIIRRKHVGTASNDIGFVRRDDGTFEAIVSDFDRRAYGEAWMKRLMARYAYHATLATLTRDGFDLVEEETTAAGEVRLLLRRLKT